MQTEQVVEHQYLAVAPRPGANADRGHGDGLGDHASHLVGHALEDDREAPGVDQGQRVVDQRGGGVELLALHLEPAEGVDRLGREPDVAHHGDLGVDDGPDHVDVAVGKGVLLARPVLEQCGLALVDTVR